MTPAVLIIDADPIVYGAGFAAQSTTYEYIWEDEQGELHQRIWDSGTEALQFFRENKDLTVLSKESRVEAKDASFARQCAKTQIASIISEARTELKVPSMNVEMYLSGPDNFRYKIATIAPYKGDRPPPPVHYQTVRDYLTHRWAAMVVTGIEADDRVSIRCRELAADRTLFVLATIDKDLDQVPGLHYDYKNHVFYTVDEWDAEWMFWRQCISGDSTDNIPGCYKIGEGKAVKLLETWVEDFKTDPMENREEWRRYVWQRIVSLYVTTMVKYPDRYPKGMTAEAAALETARLVFMQHYEGQLWNSPGVPYGDLSSLAAD